VAGKLTVVILAKIKGESIMTCRSLPWLLVLVFGLGALFSALTLAAEDEKMPAGSGVVVGKTTGGWNVSTSIGYLPVADLHGAPGDVGISDYRFKIARNLKLDDRLTLTLGGGYGLKHMDSSSSATLPQDLHALFVEAGARYRINDKSFASIKLYPGFYSDFKELGEDDLRMPVLALGGYSFDNGLSAVGGFVYRFGDHSGQLIPVLGFSYQPDDKWRIDLIAPRPGVTCFASRQLQLFVAGDFASDEYELKDRAFGAKAIKYNDYRVMGGVQYLPLTAVTLTTSLGYAFERRFTFFDGNRPDLRVDDVPFVKVSLDVGW
jgi:hypothetical protein